MTRVEVRTWIGAPCEVCFDLARSQSAHVSSASRTRERIVEGPKHDRLELGDVVTFSATHLGTRQRLTAQIVEFDPPNSFVDEMLYGAFKSMRHEHRFVRKDGGTEMLDVLDFEAPFGRIGQFAERRILASYMRRFLTRRGQALKTLAETEGS